MEEVHDEVHDGNEGSDTAAFQFGMGSFHTFSPCPWGADSTDGDPLMSKNI